GSDTSYELPLSLGADGIGEAEWSAPKDAPQGDYDIRYKVGENTHYTNSSFRLDEYRLPTMRASVVGPKTRTARPKALPLDLYVGFLSGGGAAGAPVKLRTAYQPLYDHPDGYEGWTFGGSPVREGTAALDAAKDELGGPEMPGVSTTPLVLGGGRALRHARAVP